MNTEILKIKPNGDGLKRAGEILRSGGLVAFPTETVYGLGANALDEKASAKIYSAKGRPSDNPLIVHIASMEGLLPLVSEIPDTAKRLMEKFWPGPMTLIFPKSDRVPYGTTGGLDTVAVRMPSHPIAAALIKEAGIPIAAPSANLSGRPSPTRAEHVIEDMTGRADMIVDGGQVGIGLESTIIDVTVNPPVILRPGFISGEMLAETVGKVETDVFCEQQAGADVRPRAPGMKYRHYAPKGELTIVTGEPEAVEAFICGKCREEAARGIRTGILCTEESFNVYPKEALVRSVGTRRNPATIAHNLFDVLREFDDLEADVIYAESFENGGIGAAIMNRLTKAAGHKVIHV